MDSFISTKTVVGDAITVGDTIILPLVDVSFGVGAGAFAGDKKQNAGGGMGAKISPSAILVISNGVTKLVNVKNQDTVTKILDMVPDFVNKFTSGKKEESPVADAIQDAVDTIEKEEPKENGSSFSIVSTASCIASATGLSSFFPEVNLLTKSGTISRILVTVS